MVTRLDKGLNLHDFRTVAIISPGKYQRTSGIFTVVWFDKYDRIGSSNRILDFKTVSDSPKDNSLGNLNNLSLSQNN